MIHFAWPLVFLLLPVPYVLRRLWPRTGGDTAAAVKVPFFYEVKALSLRERKARLFRSSFFTATAWLCLITAAARPQMPSGLQSYAVPVRDVLLIMDISGSMEQKDLLLKRRRSSCCKVRGMRSAFAGCCCWSVVIPEVTNRSGRLYIADTSRIRSGSTTGT